jgi:hypothetical protein
LVSSLGEAEAGVHVLAHGGAEAQAETGGHAGEFQCPLVRCRW